MIISSIEVKAGDYIRDRESITAPLRIWRTEDQWGTGSDDPYHHIAKGRSVVLSFDTKIAKAKLILTPEECEHLIKQIQVHLDPNRTQEMMDAVVPEGVRERESTDFIDALKDKVREGGGTFVVMKDKNELKLLKATETLPHRTIPDED